MKIKLFYIVIFCLLGFFLVQAQEWEYVCSLVDEDLRKVCTLGSDTVFVVGERGLITKSTDKGITWDKRYFSNNETLNDIIFCNHEIGFIVGNNGTLLKTTDSGSSWQQVTSGTVQNINAIAAFDINNIWAVGDDGLIVYSVDMGDTWITKLLLSDSWQYLTDIKCKGSRGYIVGQGGVVLSTEDGGTTWKEQILTEYDEIWSLSIINSKTYALAGTWIPDIIFTEDDINWYILAGINILYAAIYFEDDHSGFIASYDYTTCRDCLVGFWIFKTTDSANSWEEVYYQFFKRGNSTRSNFAFSINNEFGYCVFGKRLIRTPYTGEFDDCKNYDEINLIQSDNPVLILNQQGDELQINSNWKMINRVELITIEGIKIMQKAEETKMIHINVSSLPKGIYLINVSFSDKTSHFSKWIKN
jgi:hypothetical protein